MPYPPPAITTPGETPVVVAATRRLAPPFLPGATAGPADEPYPLDSFLQPADAALAVAPAEAAITTAAEETVQSVLQVGALAEHLRRTVDGAAGALRVLTEPDISHADPGRWSRRQLLGHLIDSAVNSHHRFVRAQRLDSFSFPAYDQEAWVAVQHYHEADWEELVELWWLYNRHLARVIEKLPAGSLDVPCVIGDYEPVTLGFLVQDYIDHLEHHLRQLGVA